MKNLLDSLPREDGTSEVAGGEFIVRRSDAAIVRRLGAMDYEEETIRKAANFPLWFRNLAAIVLLTGLCAVEIALELLTDGEIPYETAVAKGVWWIFGVGWGLVALGGAGLIAQWIKQRNVYASSAVQEHRVRKEKMLREALDGLSVPADAPAMDAFGAIYRVKKGKTVRALPNKSYYNFSMCVYREGDALCLANAFYVMQIPFGKIESVSRVKKRIYCINWNKTELPRRGRYRSYKVKSDSTGMLYIPFFYRILIRGSEPFELVIPSYDFETVAPFLGSKAQTADEVKK